MIWEGIEWPEGWRRCYVNSIKNQTAQGTFYIEVLHYVTGTIYEARFRRKFGHETVINGAVTSPEEALALCLFYDGR